jgi:hypothetical protein
MGLVRGLAFISAKSCSPSFKLHIRYINVAGRERRWLRPAEVRGDDRRRAPAARRRRRRRRRASPLHARARRGGGGEESGEKMRLICSEVSEQLTPLLLEWGWSRDWFSQ